MDLSLTNRTALVCGSTSGIGRACAETIAAQGATVVLLARNADKLKMVADALSTDAGQQHVYLQADFTEPESVDTVVRDAVQQRDPIDILVNNTGGPHGGAIVDAEPDEFERALRSHLVCNHILSTRLLPGMKSQNYGRIINIVSTSVRQPIPGLGVSNTTRAAVAAWAKTLSKEVATFGVTVNCVLPGATRTARLASLMKERADRARTSLEVEEQHWMSQIAAGRFAEPEEIGWAVAFLASAAASYITGINLPIDGGRIDCI
jgi:3-oxoacyl-[acyl-carrier protein] reductase